jgi:predicted transcriptional regulator
MYTSEHKEPIMASTTMTIRLDDEVRDRLDRLAAATQRSRSYLAAEAIEQYVALQAWQVSEIEQAMKEADAGDFGTDEEVAAVAKRWGRE